MNAAVTATEPGPTNFILLRHGQTEWNRDQRFRGRKDIPLSEAGKAEAEAVAEELIQYRADHLYASPLSRSLDTLRPLSLRLKKDLVVLPEVIDMDFGEWEGLEVSEARDRDPALFKVWEEHPEQVTFPGGESLIQVQARAMRGLSRLAREHRGQTVAVCSHRVICKLVVLGLLGLRPDRFWTIRQDTACLNRFQYDPPRAIIVTVNETHHLRKLGAGLRADF